jgi:hypothetical protein
VQQIKIIFKKIMYAFKSIFTIAMNTTPKCQNLKHKKCVPLEINWVNANLDQFGHIQFFDFFKSYSKNNAIRRFKMIVKD